MSVIVRKNLYPESRPIVANRKAYVTLTHTQSLCLRGKREHNLSTLANISTCRELSALQCMALVVFISFYTIFSLILSHIHAHISDAPKCRPSNCDFFMCLRSILTLRHRPTHPLRHKYSQPTHRSTRPR